jgi:Rod binding domain-containing protein
VSTSSGLPPIDESLIPQSVRSQGTKAVSLYEAALSFESVLDQQLTQALTDTLQPQSDDSSGDGSSADAATSMTLQMLPQALSQSLAADGGLGLAPQLYQSLAQSEGIQ